MAKTYLLVRLVDLVKASQQVPEWSELSNSFRNKIIEVFDSEEGACEAYNFLIRSESFPLLNLEKFFTVIKEKMGYWSAWQNYKELHQLFLEEKNKFDKKHYIDSLNHRQQLDSLKSHLKEKYDYTASTEDLRKIAVICSLQEDYIKSANVFMRKFLGVDRISDQEIRELGEIAKKSILGDTAEHYLEQIARTVEDSELELVITTDRRDIVKYIALKDIAHLLPENVNLFAAWGAPALSDNIKNYLQENPPEPGSKVVWINNDHAPSPISNVIINEERNSEIIECKNVFGDAIIEIAEKLSKPDADTDELLNQYNNEELFIHGTTHKNTEETQGIEGDEPYVNQIITEMKSKEALQPRIQGVDYSTDDTEHAKTYLFVNSFNLLKSQLYPEWSQLSESVKGEWAEHLGSHEDACIFYSKFIRTLPNTSEEGIKNHIFKTLAETPGGRFKAWDKHHKIAKLFTQAYEKFSEQKAQIEYHNNTHNYWKIYKEAFSKKYGIAPIKEEKVEIAKYLSTFLDIHGKGADSMIKMMLGCEQVSGDSYKQLIDLYLKTSTDSWENNVIKEAITSLKSENFTPFICSAPRTGSISHQNPDNTDSDDLYIEPSTIPYIDKGNIVELAVKPWLEAVSPAAGSTILVAHHENDEYTEALKQLQQQYPELSFYNMTNTHNSALVHLAEKASSGQTVSSYCQEFDGQLIFIDTPGEAFDLYTPTSIDAENI